jgi:coenzyme F420-reducing hydrogenase alpha subunit
LEAGRVTLTLTLRHGTVTDVEVTSTRNPFATRVLQGKRVDVALQAVPLTFSLSGNAQAACAGSAVEAALNVTAPAPTLERFVTVFGPPQPEEVRGLEAWTHNPQPGPQAVRAVLVRGEAALGASVHPMLPALAAGVVDQALSSEDAFEAAPAWNGAPAETGPLARQYKHPLAAALAQEHGVGLLVRLMSRLLDAHATLQRVTGLLREVERVAPRAAAPRGAQGHGVATVETARGTLAHAVTLEEDTITRWRVVAPTEWNFHPRGPIQHILRGLCANDDNALKDRARLLVLALDPCVEFVVEVAHA